MKTCDLAPTFKIHHYALKIALGSYPKEQQKSEVVKLKFH